MRLCRVSSGFETDESADAHGPVAPVADVVAEPGLGDAEVADRGGRSTVPLVRLDTRLEVPCDVSTGLLGVCDAPAKADDRSVDQTEIRELMARQAEVRGDWERLEEYGRTIPRLWRQTMYEGPDLVALLTDPEPHRAELIALVEHPERLTVRRTPYSLERLLAIGEEVFAVVGQDSGRWTQAGPSTETYTVTLRSDQSALAEELQERFGSVVEITLGQHPFPLAGAAPTSTAAAPASTIDLPTAELRIELDRSSIAPGDTVRGRVRIRNTSTTERLRFETGSPAVGVTLHPDGTRAGGFTGAIAGVGRLIDLAPGASDTLGFVAGSDAIDPTRGAALPPGHYLLVVPVTVYGDRRKDVVVTPPIDLLIAG